MIFVCVGSREYPFNRLIREIDRIVEAGHITQQVFAQIGTSTYIPKNIEFERFLERNTFNQLQEKAEIIISHGGAGALIGALKKGKKVIAVPRFEKFGEHIDDHQLQICNVLANEGYLLQVLEIDKLDSTINKLSQKVSMRTFQSESRIPFLIKSYLGSIVERK